MIRHHSPARYLSATLLRLGAILGMAVLLLVGGASAASASTNHHITIASYAYSPNPLAIAEGDSVTWTNTDSVGHDITITSGPVTFQSPLLAKGQSWSYTFTSAGTYNYICSVHPDMKATVTVAAAPAPAPAPATAQSVPQQHTSMKMQVITVPAHSPVTKRPAPTTSAPTAPIMTAAPAAASSPTLSPLLIVAGCAAGAVVFCLLLLASRPIDTK